MIAEKQLEEVISIQQLSAEEIDQVGGASTIKGSGAFVAMAAIGIGSFGSGWMAMGAMAAFATAPVAVVGMGALAAYGAYQYYKG